MPAKACRATSRASAGEFVRQDGGVELVRLLLALLEDLVEACEGRVERLPVAE